MVIVRNIDLPPYGWISINMGNLFLVGFLLPLLSTPLPLICDKQICMMQEVAQRQSVNTVVLMFGLGVPSYTWQQGAKQ